MSFVAHSLLLNRTETLATQANALTVVVACVSSVSSRVRRESWDESKKKRSSRSNFRAITRLETLVTQATVVDFPMVVIVVSRFIVGY